MPVVKVSQETMDELDARKIDKKESYNKVISRVLNGSREFVVDNKIVEVISNGTTIFTVKPGRSGLSEKTIQD